MTTDSRVGMAGNGDSRRLRSTIVPIPANRAGSYWARLEQRVLGTLAK
jgi:hypothetical protein